MPRADARVPSRQLGQVSPSRTSAASMVPSGEVAAGHEVETWLPSTSAPVTQRVPSTTRGSTRKRISDGLFSPSAPGPM